MTLEPRPGFNWTAVSWGGPDEPPSDKCSYCGDELPEDSVPLMMWNKDGWAAQFCDTCQVRWWGLESADCDPVLPAQEPEIRDAGVTSCRVCGCTDDDCSGCIKRTGRACHWVEADLRSACRDAMADAPGACVDADGGLVAAEDPPGLGSCCGGCGRKADQCIVMLQKRAPTPGRGWGCFVCGCSPDGATAVLCNACGDRLQAGEDVVRFACDGWPGENTRVPVEKLTEPFDHDPTVPH